MDLLLLILIIVALLSLGGWGYGYYGARPVEGDVVAAPAGWVSPLGILALLAVVAVIAMLVTGWRPTGVAIP